MLSWRTTVKRATSLDEAHAGSREPVGQPTVCECHDVVPVGMDVAMHVADEMPNLCRFGEVTRRDDEDVLVGRADDVRRSGVMVQELTGMKNSPRRQLERENDAIGRLDETSHATPIDSAHRQLDDRQSGRRLCVWMECAHRDGTR
jgi:hypothetical protein